MIVYVFTNKETGITHRIECPFIEEEKSKIYLGLSVKNYIKALKEWNALELFHISIYRSIFVKGKEEKTYYEKNQEITDIYDFSEGKVIHKKNDI